MTSIAQAIRAALLTADPRAKAMAARKLARDWRMGRLAFAWRVDHDFNSNLEPL